MNLTFKEQQAQHKRDKQDGLFMCAVCIALVCGLLLALSHVLNAYDARDMRITVRCTIDGAPVDKSTGLDQPVQAESIHFCKKTTARK